MPQQTQINGNRYSFTSVRVELDGVEQPKGVFKSINYDANQDPGIVDGNQITMVGRTAGYGRGTGNFEMLVSEWDDFVSDLTSDGQYPIMSVDFDISVAYSENNDDDVRIDTLLGCRISSIGSNNATGNDASTKTCNLTIARIKLAGIEAFADPTT